MANGTNNSASNSLVGRMVAAFKADPKKSATLTILLSLFVAMLGKQIISG